VSTDGQSWIKLKNNFIFNNIKNNPIRQDVLFEQPVQSRYIRIEPVESVNNVDYYAVSELGTITR